MLNVYPIIISARDMSTGYTRGNFNVPLKVRLMVRDYAHTTSQAGANEHLTSAITRISFSLRSYLSDVVGVGFFYQLSQKDF